jgi:hypothetical protein
VTDMQDRASAASLVTAGSVLLGPVTGGPVLLGPVLASTVLGSPVLFAAGCASSPAADRTLRGTRSGSSAASSACRRPIPAEHGKPAVN